MSGSTHSTPELTISDDQDLVEDCNPVYPPARLQGGDESELHFSQMGQSELGDNGDEHDQTLGPEDTIHSGNFNQMGHNFPVP